MAIILASKSELLEWINSYFDVNYTKIEQCGNGVVYCLIFDTLYPNTININKLSKNPKTEFQILTNFKLLQNGFNKVKISRDVNVERLIKCRLQDNLEFLQWFAKLWCDNNKDFTFSSLSSIDRTSSRKSSLAPNKESTPTNSRKPSITPSRSASSTRPVSSTRPSLTTRPISSRNTSSTSPSIDIQEFNKLKEENKLLNEKLDDILVLKEGLETERNFYFNKLRQIEIICQNIQTNKYKERQISLIELTNNLTEIMYSTEDGFLTLNDDIDQNDEDNVTEDNGNDLNTTPDAYNNKENLSIVDNNAVNDYKIVDSSLNNLNILNQLNESNNNDELFDDETF